MKILISREQLGFYLKKARFYRQKDNNRYNYSRYIFLNISMDSNL